MCFFFGFLGPFPVGFCFVFAFFSFLIFFLGIVHSGNEDSAASSSSLSLSCSCSCSLSFSSSSSPLRLNVLFLCSCFHVLHTEVAHAEGGMRLWWRSTNNFRRRKHAHALTFLGNPQYQRSWKRAWWNDYEPFQNPFKDVCSTRDTNTSTTCSTMRSKLRSNERSWFAQISPSRSMHKEVEVLSRVALGKFKNGPVPLVV